MRTFAVKQITSIQGSPPFFKLVVDDKCEFDEFCLNCKGNEVDQANLDKIFNIFREKAAGYDLPDSKWKSILGSTVGLYEARSNYKRKLMRAYCFREGGVGIVIVLAGGKKGQNRDINRAEKIVKAYKEWKKRQEAI